MNIIGKRAKNSAGAYVDKDDLLASLKTELNFKMQNARGMNDPVITQVCAAVDNMRMSSEQDPPNAALQAFDRLTTPSLETLYNEMTNTTTANQKISYIVKQFFAQEKTNLRNKSQIIASLEGDKIADGRGAMAEVVKLLLAGQYMKDGMMTWGAMEKDINEMVKDRHRREAAQHGHAAGYAAGAKAAAPPPPPAVGAGPVPDLSLIHI